jgi:hypothetical protein
MLMASLRTLISESSAGMSAMFLRTASLLFELPRDDAPEYFSAAPSDEAAMGKADNPRVDHPSFFKNALLTG